MFWLLYLCLAEGLICLYFFNLFICIWKYGTDYVRAGCPERIAYCCVSIVFPSVCGRVSRFGMLMLEQWRCFGDVTTHFARPTAHMTAEEGKDWWDRINLATPESEKDKDGPLASPLQLPIPVSKTVAGTVPLVNDS